MLLNESALQSVIEEGKSSQNESREKHVLKNLVHQRLLSEIPGIRSYLSGKAADLQTRNRIEEEAANLFYIAGDIHLPYSFPVLSFISILADLENTKGVSVSQLFSANQIAFDLVIQSVVGDMLKSGGEHQKLLEEIMRTEDSTAVFIECSKSFLLTCTLKLSSNCLDGISILPQLGEVYRTQLGSMDFLQRLQLDRIRAYVSQAESVVAFFCPDKAFRKNFGTLPNLLADKGYGVLHLYGTAVYDEFESYPSSFYVGAGLILKIDFVDLFFTATIMDILPDNAKKALIIHGSFAPFGPEAHEEIKVDDNEDNLPFEAQYRNALNIRTHFTAFFKLYDYYVVSSHHFHDMMKALGAQYGMKACGEQVSMTEPIHHHFKVLADALKGRTLPENIHVVPAGYPQIDVNIRSVEKSTEPVNTITYAPTPLNGKPVWNQYSSLYNAGPAVVEALLEAFPEYEIVFKPHIEDRNEQTMDVINRFEGRKGFRVDWSGSNYMELYAKTAVLVSDFSSTAYTFALSTLRPVLFHSPGEDLMPQGLREEGYCRERNSIGTLAQSIPELVDGVRKLLSESQEYKEKIRAFRDSNIYHVGESEKYLCESVEKMISGNIPAEWTCLN